MTGRGGEMHLPGRTSQVRRVIWGRAVAGRRGLSRPGAGPAGRGRCSDPRAPASLLVSARSGGGLRRRDPQPRGSAWPRGRWGRRVPC